MNIKRLLILLTASAVLTGNAVASDFKVGLQDDADILDPARSSTYAANVIYSSLCEKLITLSTKLEFVPQLATEWSWSDDRKQLTMILRNDVLFHDGTPFNAAAVVDNIERDLTMPESRRKIELASISSVKAAGEYEVLFTLKSADATLLSQFTTEAGIMISPTAAKKEGANFGNKPVCTGPYAFSTRVAQDRIVLKKFDKHRNAKNFHFDTLTFLPIPDSTVRLANLKAGDLDMIERVAPTDAASVREDKNLTFMNLGGIGYQALTINIGQGKASDNPMGKQAKVRQAFSLSIDRKALNDVVFAGTAVPGNQFIAPSSPWYASPFPVPERNVDKARALLKEVGLDRVKVDVQVANNPVQLQMMQVVQSMVAEAGFDLNIQSMEFASMLAAQNTGDFQVGQIGWTGRIDPDGNIHAQVTCKGGPLNDAGYCNQAVDNLLDQAKETGDTALRKALYSQVVAILNQDLPIIYLYHPSWMWALQSNVKGFNPLPNGLFGFENVTRSE